MSMKDVNSALTQAWIDVGLGLDTAYEGVAFDPDGLIDWAAVSIIPALNEPVTLGIGGEDEESGIMQIDLFTELGKGTSKLLGWADTLQSSIVAGKAYIYDQTRVYVESIERNGIAPDGGWLRLTMSINWSARFTRPPI